MDYRSALSYLSSLEKRGIHLDLGPVSRLLQSIGNPHRSYRTIHVAGTNGKGSTCAMIASILQRAGYRVGLYTSPHLVDFRERIRVDGAMIDREELARLVSVLDEVACEELTFFEFTTALAFLSFHLHSVDFAVVEVGMGGRLDATNCVIPDISLVTTVSIEHERYLGRRIAEIAFEKGGIIKEGGICVTGVRQKQAWDVLESIARDRRARLIRMGRDFSVRSCSNNRLSYRGANRRLESLSLSLAGRHQVHNAALALAAVEALSARGIEIDDASIRDGLAAVRWEGRLEQIGDSPAIIVDGAHNPAGMRALCRTVRDEYSFQRLIVLFGVMGDKRYRPMLKDLASLADAIIITEPPAEHNRALRLEGRDPWLSCLKGTPCEVVPNVRRALQRARELAREGDMILITGSLYLVGAIKKGMIPVSEVCRERRL